MSTLQAATTAIHTYAHGMDLKRFDLAVAALQSPAAIDYSAVGGPAAEMTREQVQTFLSGLLGRPELSVHTMIGQVLAHPDRQSEYIAYYAVRHVRTGERGGTFIVYGWYEFAIGDGGMTRLRIMVQSADGDPGILG